MIRWLALLLLAWLVLPAAAAGEVRLVERETIALDYPQASAAFAIDSDIVEATALDGRLMLTGHRAGQTLVTLVLPTGVQTLTVRVDAPAPRIVQQEHPTGGGSGHLEAHYDSSTRRYSTGLAASFQEGERTARLRLQAIHEGARAGERSNSAIPSASLTLQGPERSLVLLDQYVEATPLTVDGAVLRGLHAEQDGFALHAGIASTTPWDDMLLPEQGDRALAVSYRVGQGRTRWVPHLLLLPDSHTSAHGVASLVLEHGTMQDPLEFKAELGWSGRPAASLDLSWRHPLRQVWLKGVARPAGFAALRAAHPAGWYIDGGWSEQLGERNTAALALSASRFDLRGRRPETAAGRADLRHQMTKHWAVSGGISAGSYRDGAAPPLQRSALSLGTSYDTAGFGVSAAYRLQQSSASSRYGHGGRVAVRGMQGGWRINLFADVQQQAPTLDLIWREHPELARAFSELGLVADSPEDVVRHLRDHGDMLARHGVTIGQLRLDPLRLQGGLDVSWRTLGTQRSEVGLRLSFDQAEATIGARRSYLATAYASHRIFAGTDLTLSYSRWSTQYGDPIAYVVDSIQIGLRASLARLSLPRSGRQSISGEVVHDDPSGTSPSQERQPLARVEVVLDGARRTVTDREGRFFFDTPGPGDHRIEVVLPRQPGAYFSAPSAVTLRSGEEARFAIAFSPARVSGTIRSDAGLPLAGVAVRLEGAASARTTTDSEGGYVFAAPAGEARVTVLAETLAPGYQLTNLTSPPLGLAPNAPVVADFVVRAQRVLEGTIRDAGAAPVKITALETGRSTLAEGATGRFLLRGLPAGPVVLLIESASGQRRHRVDMPPEPGKVAGVEIAAP